MVVIKEWDKYMERVTIENIQRFYEGSKIFYVSPLNGKETIYRYIMIDGDYIIVRELDLLALLSEQWGDITSLTESQIFNCNFYFFDEKSVIEKQIEWHEKEISRLQNKIDTIYCD
jgi:hypothetical protein